MQINILRMFVLVIMTLSSLGCYAQVHNEIDVDLKWKKGNLDIHFLHTGRGNASFFIFPDGTTMLYDTGDARQRDKYPYYPPFDNRDISTGQRIIEYINFFAPNGIIDYAVMGHFHNDHYGEVKIESPLSNNKAYKLTGITEVGDAIPIKFLVDRAFPEYNYPINLRGSKEKPDQTMRNYLRFINYHQEHKGMRTERLIPGVKTQIIQLHDTISYSNFHVRNVKVNQLIWLGKNDDVAAYEFNPPFVNKKGYFNGNALSIALKIRYGKFDYFVGGDILGVNKYPDYDIETPIANILGEVDALTLNHHGSKDASSHYYLKKMNPQVIAHQALHDPHFTDNVQDNLLDLGADVFATYMSEEKKKWYKKQVKRIYKSTKGHFFIRVMPGGNTFHVFVLDSDKEEFHIKEKFGPYKSN